MAFGSAAFTADMAKALDSDVLYGTGLTDEDLAYENDLVDDALATEAVKPTGLLSRMEGEEPLMSVPEASQQVDEEESEKGFDDRQLEMLGNNYSTLTAKTQRIMKILGMQQQMNDNFEEYGTPFEMLKVKHQQIDSMKDCDEKRSSIKMFNVLTAVIGEARGNPELREFVARLFSQTSEYYSIKEKKKEMKEELNMLINLRDEQEIDNFRMKQKRRIESEMIEVSGKVKKPRH
jgi:hypothetical protein